MSSPPEASWKRKRKRSLERLPRPEQPGPEGLEWERELVW